MNDLIVEKAAVQFGKGTPSVQPLGDGLINRTYKANFSAAPAIVLQCINPSTFSQPENIINNYRLLQDFLDQQGQSNIARLLPTNEGKYYWIDAEENFWRATSLFDNAYTLSVPGNAVMVAAAAGAFAAFTRSLIGLPTAQLNVIIPDFHNLDYRYRQFEATVEKAHIKRLLKATHIISEVRDRTHLIDFYNEVAANEQDYPTRVMHHDCKISNILFDKITHAVICPVDLDTVMPGKYFSDIGDMVRTMACTEDENSNSWETIDVNPTYYNAIVEGYKKEMGDQLSTAEKTNIHQSGLLLTYMQCLRFVTDFLNDDVYYQTTYPEQNLNRALNQLILLEKLEAFVSDGAGLHLVL